MNDTPTRAEPVAVDPRQRAALESDSGAARTRDTMSKILLGAVLVLVLVNTVAAVGIWWTVSQIRQTVELEVPPVDIDPSDPVQGG